MKQQLLNCNGYNEMFFGGKAKQMENESNNGKLIKPGCTKLNQVKWPNREKDDYAN